MNRLYFSSRLSPQQWIQIRIKITNGPPQIETQTTVLPRPALHCCLARRAESPEVVVTEQRPVHDVEQDETCGEQPPGNSVICTVKHWLYSKAIHSPVDKHGLLSPLLHQVPDLLLPLGLGVLHIIAVNSTAGRGTAQYLGHVLVDPGYGRARTEVQLYRPDNQFCVTVAS